MSEQDRMTGTGNPSGNEALNGMKEEETMEHQSEEAVRYDDLGNEIVEGAAQAEEVIYEAITGDFTVARVEEQTRQRLEERAAIASTQSSNIAMAGELLMNRQFEIWERPDTTLQLSGTFKFGPDRWRFAGNGAIFTALLYSLPFCTQLNCLGINSGGTEIRINQTVESIHSGKLVIAQNLSFWVFCNAGGRVRIGSQEITVPPLAWKQIVVPGHTGHFDIWLLGGPGPWCIGAPSLSTGDPYGQYVPEDVPAMRVACKRYFIRRQSMMTIPFSGTHVVCNEQFPVPMYAKPTVTFTNFKRWSNQQAVATTALTANYAVINNTGIGGVDVTGANPAIVMGAPYTVDYQAEAELP